jgi:hypothetical protein
VEIETYFLKRSREGESGKGCEAGNEDRFGKHFDLKEGLKSDDLRKAKRMLKTNVIEMKW